MTQDTNKSIANHSSRKPVFTVYMMDDKGNSWREDNYEGYGEFDDKDYYELMDEMNGGVGDRDRGLELGFGVSTIRNVHTGEVLDNKPPYFEWGKDILRDNMSANELIETGDWEQYSVKAPEVRYPNLVEDPDWVWRNDQPENCEFQGFFYDAESDDRSFAAPQGSHEAGWKLVGKYRRMCRAAPRGTNRWENVSARMAAGFTLSEIRKLQQFIRKKADKVGGYAGDGWWDSITSVIVDGGATKFAGLKKAWDGAGDDDDAFVAGENWMEKQKSIDYEENYLYPMHPFDMDDQELHDDVLKSMKRQKLGPIKDPKIRKAWGASDSKNAEGESMSEAYTVRKDAECGGGTEGCMGKICAQPGCDSCLECFTGKWDTGTDECFACYHLDCLLCGEDREWTSLCPAGVLKGVCNTCFDQMSGDPDTLLWKQLGKTHPYPESTLNWIGEEHYLSPWCEDCLQPMNTENCPNCGNAGVCSKCCHCSTMDAETRTFDAPAKLAYRQTIKELNKLLTASELRKLGDWCYWDDPGPFPDAMDAGYNRIIKRLQKNGFRKSTMKPQTLKDKTGNSFERWFNKWITIGKSGKATYGNPDIIWLNMSEGWEPHFSQHHGTRGWKLSGFMDQEIWTKGNKITLVWQFTDEDDVMSQWFDHTFTVVSPPKAAKPKSSGSKTSKRKGMARRKAKPKTRSSDLKKRKGPNTSATSFNLGTRKKGNDGKMWIVKRSGQSRRWVRAAEEAGDGRTVVQWEDAQGLSTPSGQPSNIKWAETEWVDDDVDLSLSHPIKDGAYVAIGLGLGTVALAIGFTAIEILLTRLRD